MHAWFSASLCQRSFAASQSRGIGLSRKGWVNFKCWTVGGGGGGGGSLLGNDNGSLLAGEKELELKSFETLNAEITPETIDFFVSDAEGDPDCPSEGFSSIDEAIEALRCGKILRFGSLPLTRLS